LGIGINIGYEFGFFVTCRRRNDVFQVILLLAEKISSMSRCFGFFYSKGAAQV